MATRPGQGADCVRNQRRGAAAPGAGTLGGLVSLPPGVLNPDEAALGAAALGVKTLGEAPAVAAVWPRHRRELPRRPVATQKQRRPRHRTYQAKDGP